jgi:hypothetical protein
MTLDESWTDTTGVTTRCVTGICAVENSRPERDKTTDDLRMFILDVLRHDVEEVASIVKMLNNRGCIGWRTFSDHDFTVQEVIPALQELLQKGLVASLSYDPEKGTLVPAEKGLNDLEGEEVYFELTLRGFAVWEKWSPPIEDSPSA